MGSNDGGILMKKPMLRLAPQDIEPTRAEICVMRLTREEYADIVLADTGQPLTDAFPNYVYVLGMNDMDKILEISPVPTAGMLEFFPELADWAVMP